MSEKKQKQNKGNDKGKIVVISIAILIGLALAFSLFLMDNGNNVQAPRVEEQQEIPEHTEEEMPEVMGLKEDLNTNMSREEILKMFTEDDDMLMGLFNNYLGEEMPNITMLNENGEEFKLKDLYENTPYIVEIMASWCPTCQESISHINDLKNSIDIPVFVVAPFEEKQEDLTTLLSDKNIEGLDYYFSTREVFMEEMNIPFVPITVFVDETGIIQMIIPGSMDVEGLLMIKDKALTKE